MASGAFICHLCGCSWTKRDLRAMLYTQDGVSVSLRKLMAIRVCAHGCVVVSTTHFFRYRRTHKKQLPSIVQRLDRTLQTKPSAPQRQAKTAFHAGARVLYVDRVSFHYCDDVALCYVSNPRCRVSRIKTSPCCNMHMDILCVRRCCVYVRADGMCYCVLCASHFFGGPKPSLKCIQAYKHTSVGHQHVLDRCHSHLPRRQTKDFGVLALWCNCYFRGGRCHRPSDRLPAFLGTALCGDRNRHGTDCMLCHGCIFEWLWVLLYV